MKKVKEVFKNGFYIFQSRVAANGNYIENTAEAKQLLIYARYFLKGYVDVHDFVITRHGWQMAVKIVSRTPNPVEIDEYENYSLEVWKVVSERIRLFISTYVKYANKRRGRTGVLVHSSYERFYFTTLRSAKEHLQKMKEQLIKLYQRKKKYRGRKSHYQIPKKLGVGSIFLCSREVKRVSTADEERSKGQYYMMLPEFVVGDLVKNTLHVIDSATTTQNTHKSKPESP